MKKYIVFSFRWMRSWVLVSRSRLANVEAELLEIQSQVGTSGTNVRCLDYRFFKLVSSVWGFTKISLFDFIDKAAPVAEKDLRKAEFEVARASRRLDEILALQIRVDKKGYRSDRHYWLIQREVTNRWNIFALKMKRKDEIEEFSRRINYQRWALSRHLVLLCKEGELVLYFQEHAIYPATL